MKTFSLLTCAVQPRSAFSAYCKALYLEYTRLRDNVRQLAVINLG